MYISFFFLPIPKRSRVTTAGPLRAEHRRAYVIARESLFVNIRKKMQMPRVASSRNHMRESAASFFFLHAALARPSSTSSRFRVYTIGAALPPSISLSLGRRQRKKRFLKVGDAAALHSQETRCGCRRGGDGEQKSSTMPSWKVLAVVYRCTRLPT